MDASPTLERDDELDRIAAALGWAAGGEGRAVIIEGPAGIGKSRLVRDTRALAKARGFGRLQAVGDELESAIAWSVVRQMVERSISRYSGEDRRNLLAGPSGNALRALDDAPQEAPVGDAQVARTLHALWWVAADLASYRPLLITVDDAQWSDLPSLRFLTYLSKRIADLPIALVIATRPPQERAGPLAELSAARELERVEPRPLSPHAVAALGAQRGENPAPEVVAAVHAASGGNPFLATVLLDEVERRGIAASDPATAEQVAELGPSAISRTMLARLPANAGALAAAAAVLGARAEPWLAAELCELEGEALGAATDTLRTAHVLTDATEQLVFVHPVIREAVLADMGPGERAGKHGRAAQALLRSGAPAARVAVHLAGAPPGTLPGGAALLRRAADQLAAEGDHSTAATFLLRAREELPGDDVLQATLGTALVRSGRAVEGREHLRAAAAAAAPDARERAERLASAAAATAMIEGRQRAAEELVPLVDGWDGDEDSRMVLEARLAQMRAMLPGEAERHVEHLQRFAGAPGTTREERTLLALLAQRARYEARPAEEVAAIALRALGEGAYLADFDGSTEGLVGWVVAVTALATADEIELARAEVERARSRVRERGSPLEFMIVASAAAVIAHRCGDLASAVAEAEAGLAAIAGEEPTPLVVAGYATTAYLGAVSAIDRGDRAGAKAMLDSVPAVEGVIIPSIWLGVARGRLALEEGDASLAYRYAKEVGEAANAGRFDNPSVPWRIPAAHAAQRLGREEEAATLAREHLELARSTGTATDLGTALRLLARMETEDRVERLEEAVATLEDSVARLELAGALTDLGEALRVVRRRKDARDVLRRGAEIAMECEARPLQQRAADALASLGDRPRELMFSGLEGLTASERRVAELASSGRSNRDIAQELFVTPKTVENHLGRVYMKLGIAGRRELSGSLA